MFDVVEDTFRHFGNIRVRRMLGSRYKFAFYFRKNLEYDEWADRDEPGREYFSRL